jgi:hypothetical protein
MKDKRLQFFELLFDPGDKIAFGADPKSCNKPIDPYPFILNTNDEQFCLHALKDWRNTENVTKITTMLFECDDKGIDQEGLILESGIPFTTMVNSGNKSMHTLIRMTEPFNNKAWHQEYWHTIAEVLQTYGFKSDRNARLLTQITRLPESIRSKTGEVQTLEHIRNRVSPLELNEWLAKHDRVVKEPQPPKVFVWPESFDKAGDLEKFQRAIRWTENNNGKFSKYMTTGLHNWLFQYGINCYKNKLELGAAINLGVVEFGPSYTGSSGTGQTEKVIQQGYVWVQNKG